MPGRFRADLDRSVEGLVLPGVAVNADPDVGVEPGTRRSGPGTTAVMAAIGGGAASDAG